MMIADERGVAYTEMLIAFPIALLFALGIYMLAYMLAADLIVERAASASVRAASVFFADNERFYPSEARRDEYVHAAAARVAMASPAIDPESIKVEVSGDRAGFSNLTAHVEADFRCAPFIVSFLCGPDSKVVLNASATMPFQGP